MYLTLGGGIEVVDGAPTPVGKGLAFLPEAARAALVTGLLPTIAIFLPVLGLLMVSRVRYVHLTALLFGPQDKFPMLVGFVFVSFLLYLAPVPFLFVSGLTYVTYGVVSTVRARASANQPATET